MYNMGMRIIDEFKEFAVKGNAIELAVGVIIGTAFGRVISSLVNDVIMPPLGLLLGGVDFADKMIVLKRAVGDVPAITLNYGLFVNAILTFLITAWAMFLVVKMMNRNKRKEVEKVEKKQSEEVKLLQEIRDAVRK